MGKGTVLQYLDVNLLYEVMQATGSQVLNISNYDDTITTTAGSDAGAYASYAVQTNPNTAFEVLAVGMESMIAPNTIATTGTGTEPTTDTVDFHVSYYQPQPPASNAKTFASTTGNLAFRNRFAWQKISGNWVMINYGSATSGIAMADASVSEGLTIVLPRPVRFVGTALAVGYSQNSYSLKTEIFNATWIVGRYVGITPSEYVNLIALASGQAVLPPSILG